MRVILADPYLTGYSGHCYSYLRVLRDALERLGIPCAIVGSEAASPAFRRETGVVAGFSGDVRHWRSLMLLLRRSFIADLNGVAARHGTGRDRLWVLNSLRFFHLAPLARWLAAVPADRRPAIAVVLHFSTLGDTGADPRAVDGYRKGFAALARVGGVRLLADTEPLAAEFARLTSLPVDLAPIPPALTPADLDSTSKARQTPSPLVVAFAGEARRDKGFHLLADLARDLAPDIAAGRARLVAQAHNPDSRAETFHDVIASLAANGARLLQAPLSEADYVRFLADADILVLPYAAPHYRRQSSGVFVEALVTGKVVVTTRRSWMGEHIVRDGGGRVFDPGVEGDLAVNVRAAIETYADLSAASRRNAGPARAFHSADNLARELLAGARAAIPGRA